MNLEAQNIICLVSNFNKDDMSIDSLRNIFGEMPLIQSPVPLNSSNVPPLINLPVFIDFQTSCMKIIALNDRLEISNTTSIQQDFPNKIKSCLNCINKDYAVNAFGFNFDFVIPCASPMQQLMELSSRFTLNHSGTIITHIGYTLNSDNIVYSIDFNDNFPNLHIHANCHFDKSISLFELAKEIGENYHHTLKVVKQLIEEAIGE